MRYIVKYSVFESNWSDFKDIIKMSFKDIKKHGLIDSFKKSSLFKRDDSNKRGIALSVLKFVIKYNMADIEELLKYKEILFNYIEKFIEEKKKDYSEQKYKMSEEILYKLNIYERKRKKELDNLIINYYSLTSRELLEDINDSIEYFSTSEYIKKFGNWENELELLKTIKHILSDSDIAQEIKNILH